MSNRIKIAPTGNSISQHVCPHFLFLSVQFFQSSRRSCANHDVPLRPHQHIPTEGRRAMHARSHSTTECAAETAVGECARECDSGAEAAAGRQRRRRSGGWASRVFAFALQPHAAAAAATQQQQQQHTPRENTQREGEKATHAGRAEVEEARRKLRHKRGPITTPSRNLVAANPANMLTSRLVLRC